ncbi:murein L,D-transpeptidase [Sphingosinicella sp. CPCC 101087]|uniref:L,D-transpeptidase family protein n=1 Tax=Sphingosinicella sp. CPCC 101087 TaxID=2497754 RepID=UPI001FB05056|nr:L,D-transpeptidase family protein [Sphingosinicella sp. CPCC 101087]
MAALLLSVAACGSVGGGGDGGEGVAAVQPSRVTESDLRAAISDPRLTRFYEARAWQPAWNQQSAAALVDAIGAAGRHALDPNQFLASAARSEAPAAREAGLSLAALTYAEALARGRTDPKRLRPDYTMDRPDPDLAAGLNQALEQGNVGEWLEGLAPQDEEYRLLSETYVAAARQAAGEGLEQIPAGDTISAGGSDPRVPAIATALRRGGYLPAQPEGQAQPGPEYGGELVEAVRRLQDDHGLEPSGEIDEATLEALNRSAFDRARILAVNLERRRWLPRQASALRIDVNIPAATLQYWRDGQLVDQRRVIVGQPGNETPQLASPIFRLVANPTWTVPESIAEEEILPKGASYLRRNNMTMRDGMIVQEPGPTNSLGEVKFDMRNDLAIYLHDTPAKTLFEQDRRQLSHGCVRVHDALGFAAMLAEQEGVSADWRKAVATGEETFVPLPREIPVRLLYHSAFVEGGRIRFRPDPYGFDEDVAEALGLPARPRPQPAEHIGDVGP